MSANRRFFAALVAAAVIAPIAGHATVASHTIPGHYFWTYRHAMNVAFTKTQCERWLAETIQFDQNNALAAEENAQYSAAKSFQQSAAKDAEAGCYPLKGPWLQLHAHRMIARMVGGKAVISYDTSAPINWIIDKSPFSRVAPGPGLPGWDITAMSFPTKAACIASNKKTTEIDTSTISSSTTILSFKTFYDSFRCVRADWLRRVAVPIR